MNKYIKDAQATKVYEDWLFQTFPRCFNCTYRPLSLSVVKEIGELLPEGLSKRQLRRFIYWYTSRLEYAENFASNQFRINLDGSDAEEIDDIEREQAQIRLIGIYMQKEEAKKRFEENALRKEKARLDFLKKIAK